MNIYSCPHCGHSYKGEAWLKKHILKCSKNPALKSAKKPAKKPAKCAKSVKTRRKSLDSSLRIKVWETYIGQKIQARCFCCHDAKRPIRPFSYSNTFQAGHIISHANGGADSIENLLPICRDCNMNMGAENWDDYVARQPHLPLRTRGHNPPEKVVWATTVIQSLGRMYLERKNPLSSWRLAWNNRFKCPLAPIFQKIEVDLSLDEIGAQLQTVHNISSTQQISSLHLQ